MLVLHNSDFLLLLWLQRLHSKVGVETTGPYLSTRKGTKCRDPINGKEYTRKKDCYYIRVRAKSLETFAREIGFRVERKQRKLEEAIARRRKRKKRE